MRNSVTDAIREAVEVPPVIAAIASAIASDLMSGPHTVLLVSPAADLLRDFIDGVPALYLDEDDCIHTSEPSPDPMDLDDEDDEYGHHSSVPEYFELSRSSVIEALFGRTIAREFR